VSPYSAGLHVGPCLMENGVTTLARRANGVDSYEGGSMFHRLWQEEEGQDLTEYALLLVLIALAATAAMSSVGSAVSTVFANASGSLS